MKKSLTLRLLYLTLALINVFGLLCNATASVGKVTASSNAFRHVSVSGDAFFLRVIPKATTFACFNFNSRTV